MKNILPLALSGTCLVLSGCGLGHVVNPVYVVEPLVTDGPLTGDALAKESDGVEPAHWDNDIPGAIDLSNYTLSGQSTIAVDFIWSMAASDPVAAAAERDALKSALVERSNLICSYTEAQLEANSDILNFGFGEISSATGLVGALFTHAAPARLFSGIAGISSTTQAQVNEAFFKNALTSAIIQKIESNRATELAIINHNNGSSLSSYSLQDMLSDVEDYHNQCSFYEGIEDIAQSAGNSSSTSTQTPSGGGTIAATGTITTATTNSDKTIVGTITNHGTMGGP